MMGKRELRASLRIPAGVLPTRVNYNIGLPLICDIHQEYGPIMACPFPGCPNGLPEDCEWTISARHGLSDSVNRRVTWDLGDGAFTWSWESHRSGFLSIPRVFWAQAARSKLTPAVPPNRSAYQYTSLEGFLGILESGELWLTDYSYLNDVAELAHGFSLAGGAFAEVAVERPKSRSILEAQGAADFLQHRVCVASFSMDADSLSQWRAYGPIAIGFRLGPIEFGYNNTTRIKPVVYEKSAQIAMLRMLAHLNASAWERETRSEQKRLRSLYGDASDRLLDLVAFFKDSGFADEREIRMVHTENPRVWAEFEIPAAPERFRVSSGLIVPYVTTKDLSDKHPEKLPISEVVIGPSPKAEALKAGVERALVAHGYDAQVRLSAVPYRQ